MSINNLKLEIFLKKLFKIGFYKFLQKYPALKNSSQSSHYFRNNLKWSKQFLKETKNYLHRKRTIQMVLLTAIVFNFFSLFCCETFFFSHETFSFFVRLFLFPYDFFCFLWDVLFLCETFSFFMRLFVSQETFYFSIENVFPKNYFIQSENFWSTIKEGFGRLCSLCLVLWARPFHSLEKEEVKRAKRFC